MPPKQPEPTSTSASLGACTTQLASGHTVAIPTETVYGLAARIDIPAAIQSIFTLKERPSFDPLIVHIAELEQLKGLVAEWPPLAGILATAFWPGPLTLVLPKHPSLNPAITSGLETVGVRMPNHPLTLELIRTTGPLAAPSANKFGHTSPTRAEHVQQEFAREIENGDILVLDGGPSEVGVESTVLRVTSDRLEILRPGGVTADQIKARLAAEGLDMSVETPARNDRRSPGHLEHHYMPRKPLVWSLDEKPSQTPLDTTAIAKQLGLPTAAKATVLTLNEDPRLAARELYHQFREADSSTAEFIVVRLPRSKTDGLWSAITDRLKRAAQLQWPLPMPDQIP